MIQGILALSVVCGLATWRWASLLHTEDAFEWLRKCVIGIENDEDGYPAIYPDTFGGNLFHCFWCLSLAAALPVTVLIFVVIDAPWALSPLVWFGGSTVSILVEKQIMRTQSR